MKYPTVAEQYLTWGSHGLWFPHPLPFQVPVANQRLCDLPGELTALAYMESSPNTPGELIIEKVGRLKADQVIEVFTKLEKEERTWLAISARRAIIAEIFSPSMLGPYDTVLLCRGAMDLGRVGPCGGGWRPKHFLRQATAILLLGRFDDSFEVIELYPDS